MKKYNYAKIKFTKVKTMMTLIILSLLLISTIWMDTFSPVVDAVAYENKAFITVAPNPVGVGQKVTAIFFLANPTQTASAGFNPATNWNNYKVAITSPGGKVENFGPFTSDATGGAFLLYTPDSVGQYKFDFTFPGQTVAGRIFKSQTATTNLTVQQDPITGYQTPALPTNYWERPIYGENRGWYQIGGNWLRALYNNTGSFNPYTTAPNTAHVLWTRQQYLAGVVGGDYGDLTYYQAPTYQNYWAPPLIINGRLYYMEREVPGNGWVGLHCVDIRTGNELWFKDVSAIGAAGGGGGGAPMNIYGQVLDAEGVNGHGAQAFLWNLGDNWTVFDASSGKLVYTIVNASIATYSSTGSAKGPELLTGGVDPVGSIIAYFWDSANYWLCKWNSTLLLVNSGINPLSNLYLPPIGANIDWKKGIEWNVTISSKYGSYISRPLRSPACDGNVIYLCTADISIPVDSFNLTAFSAKDGHFMWNNDFKDIFIPGSTLWEFWGPLKDGVVTVYEKQTMKWYGYDEYTGQRLWSSTEGYQNAWDYYICTPTAAYGKFYVGTYGGHVYCHDIKTGKIDWTFTLPPSGYDTVYGSFPVGTGITVADGKVFAVTGEHTPNSPYWPGGACYVINATSGEEITKMPGWWSSYPAIADGYALNHNCYDGKIYCFGKGQTAITVSAPDASITQGQSIVIKGTVMDKSPGKMDYAANKLNVEGSPAIDDAYMTQWMAYLYQQKPMPNNATGVPVSIDVIDSNNNFRHVGTVTSDITGAFSFKWTPDIPGKYTVIASFAGSESYWSSSSETSFGVDMPAATAPTSQAQTVNAQSNDSMYFVASTVAIIIAIAIVGVLILRKRP